MNYRSGFDFFEGAATMRRHIFLRTNFILLFFLFGCALKPQFKTANNDRLSAQQQLSECRRDRNQLEEEIKKIDTEKQFISQLIESQKQTIQKQKAVLSLQNTVIRLFDDSEQTLQNNIKEQIKAQNLETSASSSSIKYVLENNLLFQSGSAEISTDGKALLMRIKDLLQDERYPYIRIEGHTDDLPLKSTSRYVDNLELSAARATAVVRFLHETVGIAPERMYAVEYGQYRPIASNETAEGRNKNRRIEIILETPPTPAVPVSTPVPVAPKTEEHTK